MSAWPAPIFAAPRTTRLVPLRRIRDAGSALAIVFPLRRPQNAAFAVSKNRSRDFCHLRVKSRPDSASRQIEIVGGGKLRKMKRLSVGHGVATVPRDGALRRNWP
jgi:hypothetical protein